MVLHRILRTIPLTILRRILQTIQGMILHRSLWKILFTIMCRILQTIQWTILQGVLRRVWFCLDWQIWKSEKGQFFYRKWWKIKEPIAIPQLLVARDQIPSCKALILCILVTFTITSRIKQCKLEIKAFAKKIPPNCIRVAGRYKSLEGPSLIDLEWL